MSTTVAFIQARLSSSRLPGKVLRDLYGRPVLDWVTDAAKRIPGVDRIAVLTSDEDGDDPIADWCAKAGVTCHRGSLNDVLGRFGMAIEEEGLAPGDAVMRLTADCPLLDPDVCAMVLSLFKAENAAYGHNAAPRSWPKGLDCEVFKVSVLQTAIAEAKQSFEREHVGPFIKRNRDRFPQAMLVCPIPDSARHRWTLDTPEDLTFLGKLLEAVDGKPSFAACRAALDRDPDLAEASYVGGVAPQTALPDPVAGYDHAYPQSEAWSALIGGGPVILSHGQGARVWDIDGHEFVDLNNADGTVLLGHCDPEVDDSIRRQLAKGFSPSVGETLARELSDRLAALVPCCNRAYLATKPSMMLHAEMLAKRATGRQQTATIVGNDITGLDEKLDQTFAAIIVEARTGTALTKETLLEVQRCADAVGALVIYDERDTGFRLAPGGLQAALGVTPDLAVFGPSIANGMTLSALVGPEDLMRGTMQGQLSHADALSVAAALATVTKVAEGDVVPRLWDVGTRLSKAVGALIDMHGLQESVRLAGYDPTKMVLAEEPEVLIAALADRGVYAGYVNAVSYAMTDADIDHVIAAYDGALRELSETE